MHHNFTFAAVLQSRALGSPHEKTGTNLEIGAGKEGGIGRWSHPRPMRERLQERSLCLDESRERAFHFFHSADLDLSNALCRYAEFISQVM
jgi:hypothetical protein